MINKAQEVRKQFLNRERYLKESIADLSRELNKNTCKREDVVIIPRKTFEYVVTMMQNMSANASKDIQGNVLYIQEKNELVSQYVPETVEEKPVHKIVIGEPIF